MPVGAADVAARPRAREELRRDREEHRAAAHRDDRALPVEDLPLQVLLVWIPDDDAFA
jgi:hypothetical protein